MIRRALRKAVKVLGSAGFATWLLVFVGVWFILSTLVPQASDTSRSAVAWAAVHPALEPVVRALDLHHAFTSIVFRLAVLALSASIALCAWRRTKAAIKRMRALERARDADAQSLSARHDLEVACDPGVSRADALSRAGETLGRLGVRTKRLGDLLTSVSPRWSVWGSPVFHWALFVLVAVILVSSLQRSDGLMGVAVGQAKADEPSSYGVLRAGPLHNWQSIHRSIRVDAFDPHFTTGKIDRGPTPTISVLDGQGQVIKTQRVYPNRPLELGSLTIHRSDYGLAATVSLVSTSGAETGRSVQLLDFSAEATDGTLPLDSFTVAGGGNTLLVGTVTVPLDRSGGGFIRGLPKQAKAHVVMVARDGTKAVDRVVSPGEVIALPTGDRLQVVGIGYYARINVVDDQTIPFLYVGLAVAMIGLTLAVVARQQAIVATVVDGPEGLKLLGTVRLWRNASTSRSEIESELAKALGGAEKESMS